MTLDIGTSSCKAALFTRDLKMLSCQKGEYRVLLLENGWVEQIPDEILAGVDKAMGKLQLEVSSLKSVQAVSISSQVSAQCLVGFDGRPLTNIISWMDKRAEKEAKEFVDAFSRQRIIELTGMDMVVTPAYSIAKLKWLRKHRPDLVARSRYFVQIKEIVIHQLTGNWVSDATSFKGIVDQEQGLPIPEIMDFIGASKSLIPQIKKPYETAGCLKADAAKAYSLTEGIPVLNGWNDMNAAFLGMAGFPKSSVGLDMTGTSEHFGVISDRVKDNAGYEGLNRVPFLNDKEVYYGVTSSGGQVAEWYAKEVMSYASVTDCFSQIGSYNNFPLDEVKNLIFIPYIEGERNPWNDSKIRGSWIGLERMHKQKHMAWAVLEGVCFALKAMYDRFPVKPEKFIISGGASKSDVWGQMKADIIGLPFERRHEAEAGCMGAAILALRALHPDWDMEAINQLLPERETVFSPNKELHSYYCRKYNRFIALYLDLKKFFE